MPGRLTTVAFGSLKIQDANHGRYKSGGWAYSTEVARLIVLKLNAINSQSRPPNYIEDLYLPLKSSFCAFDKYSENGVIISEYCYELDTICTTYHRQ